MKELNITINFDLDGTIANLYGVDGWLSMLENQDPTPYKIATPLLRLNILARYLNKLQNMGAELRVLSWLAKNATTEYDEQVKMAKLQWLKKHLPSVQWDCIIIIPYGISKNNYCYDNTDILFDDEKKNRNEWQGIAYDEKNIIENLKNLLTNI